MADCAQNIVGIDFDNTIVTYDHILFRWARDRHWVDERIAKNKRDLRDAIRALPDGEAKWQQAQAFMYGPGIQDAPLIAGVAEFLRACRERDIPVYIVSHKTQYATADSTGVDMRHEAMKWMERQGLFGTDLGLKPERVFFEPTRAGKLTRIRSLGCTHFIDDLEETFRETDFPCSVMKILYAPAGACSALSDCLCVQSWQEIHDYFFGTGRHARERQGVATPCRSGLSFDTQEIARVTSALLSQRIVDVHPIVQGANSQVFRATCEDGRRVAVKRYHQSPLDRADRLEVEYGALAFLGSHGATAIPRAVAMDRAHRLAVYEFIEGAPVDPATITEADVDRAVDFLAMLNGIGKAASSEWSRWADEALISFDGVVANIRGRLQQLETSDAAEPLVRNLRRFIEEELEPFLATVLEWATRTLPRDGWSFAMEIPTEYRILSPSDFGFHNAIRSQDKGLQPLVFLDFEYFGWDDPAKTVSDFLLHPAMALTEGHKHRFVTRVCEALQDPVLVKRLPVAYALFGIKWCAILLNEFVPAHWARRQFAGTTRDRGEVLAAQLVKARGMLQQVAGPRPVARYQEFPYVG